MMRSFTGQQSNRLVPVDFNQRVALAPPPSDTVFELILQSQVAKRCTVPNGAGFVLFSAVGDFRAKFGDASVMAGIPNGTVTDGSASELNPAARQIPEGVTHISLIAAANTNVTLSFYGRW